MNVSTTPVLQNRLKSARLQRGWSQEELAQRSGISRSGISAIEIERLVPSAAAALLLAKAFGCRVEDLFHLPNAEVDSSWAIQPNRWPARFCIARVAGKRLLYPAEAVGNPVVPHDGVFADLRETERAASELADKTLVLAGCDPAAGILAEELARHHGIRLLVIPRSSRQSLDLLKQGLVHVAGLHLSASGRDGNAEAVRSELGAGYQLLRIARWQEGLAATPSRGIKTVKSALRPRLRWVGRELGSGARQCLDEVFAGRKPPRHEAHSHQAVAEAIRSGFADVGVCVQLVSAQAGLDFVSIREEAYDLCFRAAESADLPIAALISVVQSARYRKLLAELPGYRSIDTGTLNAVRG